MEHLTRYSLTVHCHYQPNASDSQHSII